MQPLSKKTIRGAYGQEPVPDTDKELAMYARDLPASLALIAELIPTPEVLAYFIRLDGRAERISRFRRSPLDSSARIA
jgi:hypothetical protein